MSLDLMLMSPICPQCGHEIMYGEYNYTYNMAAMWYEIYPDDPAMVPIEGMTGVMAAEILADAIWEMKDKEMLMKLLEPKNGWGSYKGFLKFLRKLLKISKKYPDGIWRADR